MRRRHLLAAIAGTSGALAGCTVGYSPGTGRETGPSTGTETGTPSGGSPGPRSLDGVELPLPESAFRRAAPRDGIPAITDPEFAPDWSGVEVEFGDPAAGGSVYRPRLSEDSLVLGVEREGEARAYPLKLLDWHEVVNDHLGGPLLVTYCPICRSGLVARRTVRGEPTVFGVSGLLYNENQVLYDEATESLWSQILGVAVRGPMTGTEFEILPSALVEWGTWRESHPDTDVLLPPPISDTVVGEVRINYDFDLVGQAREAEDYLDERYGDDYDDSRLPKRALVVGVATEEAAVAYPISEVAATSPVNDRVGDLPVVVVARRGTATVYDRRVDGAVLTFEDDAEPGFVRAGGSRWATETGRAVDGRFEGTRLTQINESPPMFFFAWLEFNPDTRVWGRE